MKSSELRPFQQRTIDECLHLVETGDRVPTAIFGPTGSGKSHILREVIAQAKVPSILYTNRRLVFDQLRAHLTAVGVIHGIRAAGHHPRLLEDHQVAMIQSDAKAIKLGGRDLHPAKLVIVDEAHLNANGDILSMCEQHRKAGATIIGFTATPLDIGHFYKRIKISVTYQECLDQGWLLPCDYYEVERPDHKWISKVPVGEVLIHGRLRIQYRQRIVGRVIEWYEKLNPLRAPTILFAPDAPSATWFAQRFVDAGHSAASIDAGKCWVDGKVYYGLTKRDEIIERLKCGDIKVVCNRFVLTVGVDIPELAHLITAVPFGSVKVLRQAFGRILRPCPPLTRVSWQDHGGNGVRLGDPMMDMDWTQNLTDIQIQDMIKIRLKKDSTREPILCPACRKFRFPSNDAHYNSVCPDCGWESPQRVHFVLQRDGKLVKREGPHYPPARAAPERLSSKWEACYYRCRQTGRSFAQAMALFKYENHFEPQENWPLMPKRAIDYRRKIKDVPTQHLYGQVEDYD